MRKLHSQVRVICPHVSHSVDPVICSASLVTTYLLRRELVTGAALSVTRCHLDFVQLFRRLQNVISLSTVSRLVSVDLLHVYFCRCCDFPCRLFQKCLLPPFMCSSTTVGGGPTVVLEHMKWRCHLIFSVCLWSCGFSESLKEKHYLTAFVTTFLFFIHELLMCCSHVVLVLFYFGSAYCVAHISVLAYMD